MSSPSTKRDRVMARRFRSDLVAGALLALASAAWANPTDYLEQGIGGLALDHSWPAAKKMLDLRDVHCRPVTMPGTQAIHAQGVGQFCDFKFKQPGRLEGHALQEDGAVLVQGPYIKLVLLTVPLAAAERETATQDVIMRMQNASGMPLLREGSDVVLLSMTQDEAARDKEAFLQSPTLWVHQHPTGGLKVTLCTVDMKVALQESGPQ